jgi:proline racemase
MDKNTASPRQNDISFTLPARLFRTDEGGNAYVLKCIDCHAGGEPARIVLSGVPAFPESCDTALRKRAYLMEHLDHLRQVLLLEPRGYPCQNVDYVFPAATEDGHFQYVIGEQNKIYPLMSGHNTMCVATAVLECGVVTMTEPVSMFTLEAPAGLIAIRANCSNGKVTSVAFRNAPSFVEMLDATVQVPHGIGPVVLDIAYGGMWYAVVDMEQFQKNSALQHLHMRLEAGNAAEICRVGEMIKVACREQFPVQHPTIDYPGVDIIVFRGLSTQRGGEKHAKNTVVMSNNILEWDKPETWTGMLDRSPCGTGTCAVMAVMHARGNLRVGEPFVHESIVGTTFTGTILEETTVAGKSAIIPEVEGTAYISTSSK